MKPTEDIELIEIETPFVPADSELAVEIDGLQVLPNLYREASRNFLAFYDQTLAFILEYDNPHLAAWVIAMSTGRRMITGGISQVELAARLNVTKANISKCVKTVQARFGNRIDGIAPMPGQRQIEACRKFATVRKNQLKGNSHADQ